MGQIDILEARQTELQNSITAILDKATDESRGVSDEEQTEIDGHFAEIRSAGDKITKQTEIAAAQAANEARRAAQQIAPQAQIQVPVIPGYTEERSAPYRQGGKDSYFVDLLRVKQGDGEARDRLVKNTRHANDMEKRAGETTVANAGGEFAPPAWLIDDFVGFLRAGRVFADRLNKKQLPAGVSSINLPKITTGTATAAQSTQNTAINQQDVVTGSVSSTISTIAGGALVSMQLIEQSPVSIDDIILQDLANDLAQKIDIAAITAVAGVSGINAITYTNASPTSLGIAQQTQQAIDQVGVNLFREPDTIVMRPDRWGRLIAAGDSQNRPLVLPSTSYGANNTIGMANGQTAQGYAGNFRGLDVFLDANIPVNFGAGSNQDEIFVLSAQDIFLYESTPKFETFEQTFAGSLALYCRAYEFYSVLANRYPKAISLISGTGLIPQAYGV